ncbi:MAG: hypothetical protein Q8R02_12345 [Hyphomonadaceae bacterium]|nr:hypothetical protein [Hyphomonadaceae bacterium]
MIDIIRKATTETAQQKDSWGETYNGPSNWGTGLLRPQEGLKNPIGAIVNYQYLAGRDQYDRNELRAKRTEAFEFGKTLANQTSDTIDDFISLNPAFSIIAKRCIAAVFAGKMFESDEHGQRVCPKDFGKRMCADGKTRNWIHLLINIARHHYRAAPPKNRVRIITFNYDGILERVLAKQFSNVEEKFGDYSDYFEIVHPHGCCGDVLDEYDNIWKALTAWADNIWVVNEPSVSLPANVVEARDRAKQLVAQAKHIYAAGFSFSRPNCKLLGLYDRTSPVKVTYHNFDNDIGIDLAVESIVDRWALRPSERARYVRKGAGSEGRPLPIAEWIRAGFLGEMPG